MAIKILDTLSPLGSFPVAKAENIDVSGTALDTVLNSKASTATVNGKVDKVTGKGLSTNDYSDAEKQKVAEAAAVTAFVNGAFELVD